MNYRAEIDGLRALAVMPVIFFHAGFEWFGGGFVGVDVFFVISGYLITTIIITELAKGSFSIINFYERRARRILPAMFFVMLVCLPFAWLWLAPSDLKDFGQSLTAVSVFSSNILFWSESGYFGTAVELKPLLHTWSLAVEEQYYILFPVFLMFAWRLGLKWILALLAVAFVISLGVAHWGAYHRPNPTFYLLPTRVWELLVGVFVAFYLKHRAHLKSHTANQVMSLLGFGLVVLSVFVFDEKTPFPSLYALVPTLGTGLIILSAVPGTAVHRLLSLSPVVGVGLVSYSAYLWHQPILAFARHKLVDWPSEPVVLLLCFSSLIMAYISWRWVEKPFRNKTGFSRTAIFNLSLTGLAFFSVVGIWVSYNNGFFSRYDEKQMAVFESFINPSVYVQQGFDDIQMQPFDEPGKRKILLIGDSYAEDVTNALRASEGIETIQLSGFKILARCGALMTEADQLSPYRAADCERSAHFFDEHLIAQIKSADQVWIASVWPEWTIPFLPDSIDRIRQLNSNIRIFGPKFFGEINANQYLKNPRSDWFALPDSEAYAGFHDKRKELKTVVEGTGTEFIDVHRYLCAGEVHCANFDGVNILSYDGGHLTRHGAKRLGDALYADGKL